MSTSLLLGQIDSASPVAGAAGKVYRLSAQYGSSVGTDVPLLLESDDIAPAGPAGACLFRRVIVPFEYDAACAIRVTPIVDFMKVQTATTKSFPGPTQRTTGYVKVMLSKSGTTIRVRVEVITRNGPIEIYTPLLELQLKTRATASPAGAAT